MPCRPAARPQRGPATDDRPALRGRVLSSCEQPADEREERKVASVEQAASRLGRSRVVWFRSTAHDVHVHRPDALADAILAAVQDGFLWT